MDAENQNVVSTNECIVHSINLRDNDLNSTENPTLLNDNLVTSPKNEINFTKIDNGQNATLPQNEMIFTGSDKGAISIPQEITIFPDEIQDFSSELCIGVSSTQNVNVHKLSRYIFPREDPGPTKAGRLEIPPLRSLEYAINLACHKLDASLKEHWDTLCNRDVSFPEISKNGIVATKYDLKNQSALYKKQLEKERYVKSLAKNPDLNILATDVQNTRDFSAERVVEGKYFKDTFANTPGRESRKLSQNSPLFTPPSNGPLMTFLDQCKDTNMPFIENLNDLINKRDQTSKKSFLLKILSQIKTGFRYKKGRKKIANFIKMCEENKPIHIKKLAFHLCFIDRVIHNTLPRKEIYIRSLDSNYTECEDVNKQKGKCPQIYIKSQHNEDNNVSFALIDSGSEANILSLRSLASLGLSKHDIKPLQHEVSVKSATEIHENAIMGIVTVGLDILNENSIHHNEFMTWSTVRINFLVAAPSVVLSKVILGIPFLEQARASLSFSPRPKLSVHFPAKHGPRQRRRLKLYSDEIQLHLCEPIEPNDTSATFFLSNVIILDNFSLELSNQSKVKMPQKLNFKNYLQKDGNNNLSLRQKFTIPICTSKRYPNLTVAAKLSEQCRMTQNRTIDTNTHSAIQTKQVF